MKCRFFCRSIIVYRFSWNCVICQWAKRQTHTYIHPWVLIHSLTNWVKWKKFKTKYTNWLCHVKDFCLVACIYKCATHCYTHNRTWHDTISAWTNFCLTSSFHFFFCRFFIRLIRKCNVSVNEYENVFTLLLKRLDKTVWMTMGK